MNGLGVEVEDGGLHLEVHLLAGDESGASVEEEEDDDNGKDDRGDQEPQIYVDHVANTYCYQDGPLN